jgi:hypothetical protein
MHFQPARQFPGIMSQHLDLSDKPKPVPPPQPNLFPPRLPSQPPSGTDQPGPPYRPATPDYLKPLPSNIPWQLMDAACITDAYTSHGGRSGMDDSTRAAWAAAFAKYSRAFPKDPKKAAWLANQEICKTTGQDQSRDNPNQQDQFNQEWKSQHPNDTGVPPVGLPPIRF